MNANGRVNILDPVNNNVFKLYDKISIDEKTTNYRNAIRPCCNIRIFPAEKYVLDKLLASKLPVKAFL